MRGADLRVPEEVLDAVRAEALRRRARPGEVLVDFLRECWPQFVAANLYRDLCRPGQVVDAEVIDDDPLVPELGR